MKTSRLAYLLPLTFAGFWGLTFVWSEQILKVYQPITMTFIRLSLAAIFLGIFITVTGKWQKMERHDWRLILLIAFCEPFLYFIGESYGIIHSSASFAAIMVALIPLITPLGAWLFMGIRSKWTVFVGLAISFCGILYMILDGSGALLVDIKGVLFLLLAMFSSAAYALCIQKISHKYNNFTIVFYQTTLAALMFLPLFFAFEWREFQAIPFDWDIYKNLTMLAICGSCIAFVCFVESIKQLGAVKTVLFTNLIPIATAIGAYFMLNKTFTWQEVIGIGLVIFGLLISQIERKKKKA
jgi:drug/metabolite transporter (DMT)-like permease